MATNGNGGLDATDRRILALLVQDGRATLQDIADQVGLRRASVHERVRKLEAAGVIKGYHAALDPERAGRGLVAFAQLRIATGGADCHTACEGVAKALRRLPEVLEFHTVAGTEDAIIKVRCADVRALERLMMKEVSGIPGVQRVQTMVALATHFERPVPPPPPLPEARARRKA